MPIICTMFNAILFFDKSIGLLTVNVCVYSVICIMVNNFPTEKVEYYTVFLLPRVCMCARERPTAGLPEGGEGKTKRIAEFKS